MGFNAESLRRAQALCSPDMEKKMSEYRGQGISSVNFDAAPETYMTEGQLYEAGYDLSQITGKQQGGGRSISESGLPDVIKKSFMETEINVDCLNPDYQREKNFYAGMEAIIAENERQERGKRAINEGVVSQPDGFGLDREWFKSIVDECLDRKLKSLNESVIKGVRLKEGKIMLTDHAGNVFSAVLEYKGNVNEQKNKKRG